VCERARCYLSRLFDASPVGSVVGGVGEARQGPAPDPNDVRIHYNVRDTMFYI
jgi:eukaryotic translation initiation factor 2C